jgi:hypothetical protein
MLVVPVNVDGLMLHRQNSKNVFVEVDTLERIYL